MLAQDIDPNKLWLLEEGHCFRFADRAALRAEKGQPGKEAILIMKRAAWRPSGAW